MNPLSSGYPHHVEYIQVASLLTLLKKSSTLAFKSAVTCFLAGLLPDVFSFPNPWVEGHNDEWHGERTIIYTVCLTRKWACKR